MSLKVRFSSESNKTETNCLRQTIDIYSLFAVASVKAFFATVSKANSLLVSSLLFYVHSFCKALCQTAVVFVCLNKAFFLNVGFSVAEHFVTSETEENINIQET